MATNQSKPTSLNATAAQLGLGVATVFSADVATAPTDIMSLASIESRKIFPYRLDEASKTLFVAVADPNELKKPAPKELQVQRSMGRKLTLQLIDPLAFADLLPAIKERFGGSAEKPAVPSAPQRSEPTTATAPKKPTPHTSAQPRIDLQTVKIPRNVFLKIPHDVATKFRVVVFEAPANATMVKIATDQPNDSGVKRVVEVIKSKRGVSAELYQATKADMDAVLQEYKTTTDPISIAPTPVTKSIPVQAEKAAQPTQSAKHAEVTPPGTVPEVVPAAPVLPKLPPLPAASAVSTLEKPASSTAPAAPNTAAAPRLTPPANVPSISPSASGLKPATAEAQQKKSDLTKQISDSPAPPAKQMEAPGASLPVDTSAATTALPKTGEPKIQLATPLPSNQGARFPLPNISPAAKAFVASNNTAPKLAVQPQTAPPPPPLVTVSTPPTPTKPSETPTILPPNPVVAKPLPTNPVQPVASPQQPSPMSLAAKPITVQSSQVANTSSFANIATIQPTEEQNLDAIVGSTIQSPQELETVVRTGLVPKILAAILQYAINVGASDVHVEAAEEGLRVRYRVDGVLQDILTAPIGLDAPFVSRVKILAGMKIDEQRVPQDGRFSATIAQREVDFRVSTLPAIHGEKVVLRILDKSIGIRSIEQLGMSPTSQARVTAAIAKPFGIILVTGPTGSGKTTSLYAMLGTLNKPGVNIVTLEDPVEYELPGVTQTQVKPKIGFSFAEGLRSVLRQDPDIIMVGEIRDGETASLATHAALTGHLVLSTLHTNNAAGAIPRFLNMGVEPFLIASSIDAVIAQRLVRRLCDKCKQPAQLSEAMRKDVVDTLNKSVVPEVKQVAASQLQFFAPHGCEECHDGYRGRVGVYEVMTVTPEIESLTAKKSTLAEIQSTAEQQGMVTMKQDGILKALAGQTSLDEILRVTTSE